MEKIWFYSWPLGSYTFLCPQEGVIGESGGIYFKEVLFKGQAVFKNHLSLENEWYQILPRFQVSSIIVVAYHLIVFLIHFKFYGIFLLHLFKHW